MRSEDHQPGGNCIASYCMRERISGASMKYGLAFLLMAAIPGYYALCFPKASIPLGWAALSFAYVALAYTGIISGAFFKKQNGKIPLWSKILNFPFLAYTVIVWHVYRLISKEHPTDMISEDLIIGRRLLPKEQDADSEIYLDLTAEFDEPQAIREKPSYMCFPFLDANVPKLERLLELLQKLKGKGLYIHCAQGHGRTGLVTLALLLNNGTITSVSEGLEMLQSIRPALNLNRAQVRYLEKSRTEIAG
jgi:protein-tyrosine phosphatase